MRLLPGGAAPAGRAPRADLPASAAPRARLPLATALLALALAEIILVAGLYQFARPLDCALTAAPRLCALTGGLGLKSAAILTLFALFLPAPPAPRLRAAPLLGHAAGLALLLGPALGPAPARAFPAAALLWSLGGALALAGLALARAPSAAWRAWLGAAPRRALALGAAGFLLPGLVEALDVIWRIGALSHLTFRGVALILGATGSDLFLDETRFLIGAGGFTVMIADGCSGIQGVALLLALLGAYLLLDRRALRFPAALLLLPLGVALSLALNMLRIAALIEIGARGAPDLAVNGFHSNAGWLIFTALSLSLIWLGRAAPAFRALHPRAPATPPPLLADPMAARILPFATMMVAGMAPATFAPLPGLWTPAVALATGAALWLVLPALRTFDWRPGRLAPLLGLAIGLAWIATRPAPGPADLALAERLARLSPENLLLWTLLRLAGTVLATPLAEELFFRDYLLRLGRGRAMRLALLGASAALFALLHERALAAFLSGLAFGLLAWRANRIGPPVAAHVAANATIGLWALATGDWSVL